MSVKTAAGLGWPHVHPHPNWRPRHIGPGPGQPTWQAQPGKWPQGPTPLILWGSHLLSQLPAFSAWGSSACPHLTLSLSPATLSRRRHCGDL